LLKRSGISARHENARVATKINPAIDPHLDVALLRQLDAVHRRADSLAGDESDRCSQSRQDEESQREPEARENSAERGIRRGSLHSYLIISLVASGCYFFNRYVAGGKSLPFGF